MIARILIAFLIFTSIATAADFDAYVYWTDPGTRKAIEGVPVDGAEGYELQVRRMESNKTVYSGTTAGPKLTINWRTTGHYVAYVRSFRTGAAGKEYSEWKNTLDPTVGIVNGQPKAWVVLVPTN